MNPELFNKEALRKMQSPDDLDRLLIVVTPKSWLLMLTVAALGLAALGWSIFGRIPISVEGFGVLSSPNNVQGVQSTVSAQVTDVRIEVGDHVKKGQVIAEVSQSELLLQQREQAQAKLRELENFHSLSQNLERERLDLETDALRKQTEFITEEMAKARELTEETNRRAIESIRNQRKNLEYSRELFEKLNKSLKERVEKIVILRRDGLTSEDMVLAARNAVMETELKLANLDLQTSDLALQEVRQQQTDLQARSRLSDLDLQLRQLPIKERQLVQQIRQARQTRELEIQELKDRIEDLHLKLEQDSKIESHYDGTVLEVSVTKGQLVAPGTRIATVEIDHPDEPLMSLAYFKNSDGKRIQTGDRILVTPSNVERERVGSIVGTVLAGSRFPVTKQGAVNDVGSEEIVNALMSGGGAIEVLARLEPHPQNPARFKWTSPGPDMDFTAGTTTTVRVIVEQRRPISYVLPLLKTWIFADKDDRVPPF